MLSDRQIQLLEAIINEYISNAEPVGSTLIAAKYDINYSPATIRNEMAQLIDEGYLQMVHTSSGRIPTTLAYKLFLQEMMEEEQLDVLEEVAFKQRLWSNRYEFEKMLRQAVLSLSDLAKQLAFTTTEDGYVINAGAVNLLDEKEFWDIDVTRTVLHVVDRFELLDKYLSKLNVEGTLGVGYLIGSELGDENLASCGLVATKYQVGKRTGYVGVIGPARMHYQKVIPAVRYTKNIVEELGGSW